MNNSTVKFYVGMDVSKKSIEIYVLRAKSQAGKFCRINNKADKFVAHSRIAERRFRNDLK